jgi:hypothetical protein
MLAACSNATEDSPEAQSSLSTSEFALSCDMLAMNSDALMARFGAANFSDQTLDGPEGEQYTATVLYPNDPSRRAEIIWEDDARSAVAVFSISGEHGDWVGPHGVRLGASLAQVEQANGASFMLYGFDWDYGGWTTQWNGGAFEGPDCLTRMRFRNRASAAGGSTEFASDSADMRAADAVVDEFNIRVASSD